MNPTIFSTVILPVSLILIMLGLGISLVVDDFRRVLRTPKAALVGLINQLVILPLIGFAICIVLDVEPLFAVGLMILSACPGGVTSNLISHVSGGDLALSVSLTAISSLITVVTIPFITVSAILYFDVATPDMQSPVGEIMKQVFALTVLPVGLGMFVRRKWPKTAMALERPIRIASVVIFVFVIFVLIYEGRDMIVESFVDVGLSTALLNVSTMILGFAAARIFSLSLPQAITVTVESGIQNGTLAVTIAMTTLGISGLEVPAAIYSLLMFVSGGAIMVIFGRRKKDTAEA